LAVGQDAEDAEVFFAVLLDVLRACGAAGKRRGEGCGSEKTFHSFS